MRNVKSMHYCQIDHRVRNINHLDGIEVLESPVAWEKKKWIRKYLPEKPREGYFIWVKKQVDFPITACVAIASPRISQDLTNLFVLEKNISATVNGICNAIKTDLNGTHRARGKIIAKRGASLKYNHFHRWGREDNVSTNYEFILERNSTLIYNYQNLFPPKNLNLKTTIDSENYSSSNLTFVAKGLNSKISIEDTINLLGDHSRGIARLRLVGKKDSSIKAVSKIIAQAAGKGHLDCQGLLVSRDSTISLVPELVCKNKDAQITHEASIGKVSEDELNYLRMRGLSEKEAIDLIVNGFLQYER